MRAADIVEALLRDGHCIQKSALGDSMRPAIPSEAMVRVEPVRGRVGLGDVVLFKALDGRTKMHRVAMVFRRDGETYVQAWGDNCRFPDPPVAAERIIGRVTAVATGEAWRRIENRKWYIKRFALRYAPYYMEKIPGSVIRRLRSGFQWPQG